MAALADKVQNALDESRMLVLGAQVLLGFNYRAFLEPEFERLPQSARVAKLIALLLVIATIALLLLPSARHRLVEGGNDSPAVMRFAQRVAALALLPLSAGIGLELYVVVRRAAGGPAAAAVAAGGFALGMAAWFGLPLAVRRRLHGTTAGAGDVRPARDQHGDEEVAMCPTGIDERVRHVLTEVRVVLPGTQALLGFQLGTILMETFAKLPRLLETVHFMALALVLISVVALMAPAPFHRIVERGEATERLHRFATGAVLTGMIALAGGIAADLFVVVSWFAGSPKIGAASAFAAFAVLVMTWYLVPLVIRGALRNGRRWAAAPRSRQVNT
jgi:hypothetical protein